MKKLTFLSFLFLVLLGFSCQEIENSPDSDLTEMEGNDVIFSAKRFPTIPLKDLETNARLTGPDVQLALYKAEYITSPISNEMGRTLIFGDYGNKQLSVDFSPLLKLNGTTDISYYINLLDLTEDVSNSTTEDAVQRAANTWEAVNCSEIGLYRIPSSDRFGIIATLFGFGGFTPDYIADVNHVGWMPGSFFDLLAPGGSNFILGVTFTFIFVDGNGEPLDTNGDGKIDSALAEIYYNDNFPWNDGEDFDIETVALHEMGHGLSQAHFGKGFIKNSGEIQISPRAVMNAIYFGSLATLQGTDNAGHCGIWEGWPAY